MPRKNERKSVSQFEEAAKTFEEVVRTKADDDGFPKSLPRPLPDGEQLKESALRLSIWLKEFEKEGDCFSYSMLLQVWLIANEIDWPKDVFRTELMSLGRGRPPSKLGPLALQLYKPNEFGWKKVAKLLVPGRYQANPVDAEKYIRDLAKTAENEPKLDKAYNNAMGFGCVLLGIASLLEE